MIFVKHELKGVLKFKGRNLDPPPRPPHRLLQSVMDTITDRYRALWTPSQTVTDTITERG